MEKPARVRIAALGDLHCGMGGLGDFRHLLSQIPDRADILLLAGDLTDYGLENEARIVARELALLKLPIIAVLGNHDYQTGLQQEVGKILSEVGVNVLDGQSVEVLGVGFAGVKGFGGGFGVRALEPWGERIIKQFVQEALDESLKLEMALSRLRTPQRIALLHYSPIQATVEGEPLEIYPFLGSSRLEEPLDRYHVTAVFHGHAHRGHAEGKTRDGIPVYNVSLPLLQRLMTDQPAVRIIEVPTS